MAEDSRRRLLSDDDNMSSKEAEHDYEFNPVAHAYHFTTPPSRRHRLLVPSLSTLVVILAAAVLHLALRGPVEKVTAKCESSVNFDCAAAVPDEDKPHPASKIDVWELDPGPWEFKLQRDERNYALTDDQCETAFPGLFEEIDRSVARRKALGRKGLYTRKYMDEHDWAQGTVRAMIYDGELYLRDITNAKWFGHRMQATLHSINRALSAAPEPLPNIYFAATDADFMDPKDFPGPYWSYTRKPDWNDTWLMPDYGFYSWPEPGVGTFQEVRRRMRKLDNHTEYLVDKIPQIFWRGNIDMDEVLRSDLLHAGKGKGWADVGPLVWNDDKSMSENYLTIQDHCKYMMLMHTEGRSYSGRLKYLLNCRSLIFTHKLAWIQPFEYLLVPSGPKQNYVEVERDFSDLEKKVTYYLDHPDEAERVVDNALRTFRDRYVTPASTACYWRRLIRGWAEISEEPAFEDAHGRWKGVPWESASLMGQLHWKPR